MASNEDASGSRSSSDADDAPPNKVRKISSSGSVESEVVASRSPQYELTQEDSGSEEQTGDEEINVRTPLNIEVYNNYFWRNKTLCAMLWRKGATSEPQVQTSNAVEVTAKAKAEENETLCNTQDADNTQTPVCVSSSDAMKVKAETKAEENETLVSTQDADNTQTSIGVLSSDAVRGNAEKEPEENENLRSTQDADNTIQCSSDAVEAKAETERKPILIGLQLSTSASVTPVSYPLCVDENFRSNQVKWKLKAFDSQRKKSDCEIFKRADSRIVKKNYAELFPSTTLTNTSNENTENDYKQLLSMARQIRQSADQTSDSRMCHYLYRDKLSRYFKDLEANSNNVMEVYVKDANGDPAAAIHGLLNGLFFSANVNFRTGQPRSPRFGDRRVKIPPEKILTEDTNMYFGDFYCLNTNHLVTLVVTRTNSEADEFCRKKKLPLLGRTKGENPFLYFSGGDSVSVSSQITVEVFYTENIDLKELSSRYDGKWERFGGWEDNRQGDKWKKSYCRECNLYTTRIPDAFLV